MDKYVSNVKPDGVKQELMTCPRTALKVVREPAAGIVAAPVKFAV